MSDKTRIGCTVRPDVHHAFDVKATEMRYTMSEILRAAVQAFLMGRTANLSNEHDLRELLCEYEHGGEDDD